MPGRCSKLESNPLLAQSSLWSLSQFSKKIWAGLMSSTEKYFPTISFRINDEVKPRHAMLLVTHPQWTTTCGHVQARPYWLPEACSFFARKSFYDSPIQMLSWEECTQLVSLRPCLDRMGWILGVSMESCHHRQKKYNTWKYFPL